MPQDIMFFTLYEFIGNILTSELEDIRKDRKNKKWIFPVFPEDDSNLPEIVLELGPINYESESSTNFLGYLNNNKASPIYYRKANSQFRITVLTEKRDVNKYKVTKNNIEYYLYGEKLNTFLMNEVKDLLFNKHEEGALNRAFDKFRFNNIEFNYDVNKTMWGSTLLIDIEFRDFIVREYKEGSIIREYSINEIITNL